jgi:hypothetical protein
MTEVRTLSIRCAPLDDQRIWGHDKSSSQVSGISEHKGNDVGLRGQ